MKKQNSKEFKLGDDFAAATIGDILPDGWVVGPVSPDTGIVMAIEPVIGAVFGCREWQEGEDHAAWLRRKGNANARQPSANELNAIYNEVVKAELNDNAQLSTEYMDRYWSGTMYPNLLDYMVSQSFDNGDRYAINKKSDNLVRVRCVRDEPGLTLVARP